MGLIQQILITIVGKSRKLLKFRNSTDINYYRRKKQKVTKIRKLPKFKKVNINFKKLRLIQEILIIISGKRKKAT